MRSLGRIFFFVSMLCTIAFSVSTKKAENERNTNSVCAADASLINVSRLRRETAELCGNSRSTTSNAVLHMWKVDINIMQQMIKEVCETGLFSTRHARGITVILLNKNGSIFSLVVEGTKGGTGAGTDDSRISSSTVGVISSGTIKTKVLYWLHRFTDVGRLPTTTVVIPLNPASFQGKSIGVHIAEPSGDDQVADVSRNVTKIVCRKAIIIINEIPLDKVEQILAPVMEEALFVLETSKNAGGKESMFEAFKDSGCALQEPVTGALNYRQHLIEMKREKDEAAAAKTKKKEVERSGQEEADERAREAESKYREADKKKGEADRELEKAERRLRKAKETIKNTKRSVREAERKTREAERNQKEAEERLNEAEIKCEEAERYALVAERRRREAEDGMKKAERKQKNAEGVKKEVEERVNEDDKREKEEERRASEGERMQREDERKAKDAERRQREVEDRASEAERRQGEAENKKKEAERKQSVAEERANEAERKRKEAERKKTKAERKLSVAEEMARKAERGRENAEGMERAAVKRAEEAERRLKDAEERKEEAEMDKEETQKEKEELELKLELKRFIQALPATIFEKIVHLLLSYIFSRVMQRLHLTWLLPNV